MAHDEVIQSLIKRMMWATQEANHDKKEFNAYHEEDDRISAEYQSGIARGFFEALKELGVSIEPQFRFIDADDYDDYEIFIIAYTINGTVYAVPETQED